jgi:hypothetical protein
MNAKYVGALLVVCGLCDATWGAGSLATGTVVDALTHAPLDHAYVLAAYHQPRTSGGIVFDSWCVKTLGVYTGSDGRFSFPLERMDGYSPYVFTAIKSGYYGSFVRASDGTAWRKRSAKDYTELLVMLRKQDPNDLNFVYSGGDEYCEHAAKAKDAAAGTEFLRIEFADLERYGVLPERAEERRKIIKDREERERAGN